ncbi:NAD(P)/FAD-dependent oxidoreductase [Bacillus salipaludis]|uniref:NAD(P)/FAD-dependent oxidoreductase n=1 Tax=Bacillus salipaludis TaxID=2547811 RepID=A0A4R5VW16_9BACI|nr:nitrite reductase large subunit NirB [Bacillus salipaludis]MDQ6597551.1 nitrite reductase large subunit NirB [Bacillus salipaludis]TDK63030.1 NAD(P)/FAD-dependent oxidoreductase [Bacillus salipaludis]
MEKEKLVLVGNGMAGVRCIEEIIKISHVQFDITIFGSESHVNYNRILLSSVLQGRETFKEITLNEREWYDKHQIQLFTGETVTKIDKEKQVIKTDQNREISYDHLILATGSVPFLLPITGADKDGVFTFRTIEDCKRIIEASKHYKKAAVIGGGVLGLEAASGLLNLGMDVQVIHNGSFLMERQLDQTASQMLQNNLEKQGVKFLFEKETKEIIGNSRVEGLRFKDGTDVETDLVVIAVGVKPNVQLAIDSGINTNRAILVNDYMETSAPNIYAVGECVEHRRMVYGLVKPLYEQGKILAKRICGQDTKGYVGSILSTQLKISGVEVFSVGMFAETEASKSINLYDGPGGVYKKLVFQDQKMMGAVLFGDIKDQTRLLEMIVNQEVVPDGEELTLLQPANQEESTVAIMPCHTMICNCNGVTKGAIIDTVQKNGLTNVDEIKKYTKASGSCGGCKPLVAKLLSYIQSDKFEEKLVKETSMCDCTSLTEEEVVLEMQVQGLSSLQEVMDELAWKNRAGCTTCRPAIHYYLTMIDPEYENKQSNLTDYDGMNVIHQVNKFTCNCEKKSSLELANDLVNRFEFLLTPSQVKISVSACIHNGPDSTINDLVVIGIDRGWEIYVGGWSGGNARTSELLCIAETNLKAIEMISGCIQYYRESANYMEKMGKWMERAGLIHVREVLFDDEHRQQLLDRLGEEASIRKAVL